VEVLVGALFLGIFISFVYGAVVSAFNVRNVVQSTTSAMAGGTVAIELVARDLENALIAPIEGFDAFKAEDEGGDRTRIDFVTTVDSRGQEEVERKMVRSDVTETGYRLRQGEGGAFVLYRREQFGVDDKPLEGGDYHKVIDGVRRFSMEFHAEDPSARDASGAPPTTEEEGVKTWDAKEEKRLPRSVRITLVIEGRSTNPSRAEEMVEFRCTRSMVLPGSDDRVPAKEEGNGNPGPGGG